MTMFPKTTDLNGSGYVEIPIRSSVFLNFGNDSKYWFLWSILAHLHPVEDPKNGHSTKVLEYRQYVEELIIQGFDFRN